MATKKLYTLDSDLLALKKVDYDDNELKNKLLNNGAVYSNIMNIQDIKWAIDIRDQFKNDMFSTGLGGGGMQLYFQTIDKTRNNVISTHDSTLYTRTLSLRQSVLDNLYFSYIDRKQLGFKYIQNSYKYDVGSQECQFLNCNPLVITGFSLMGKPNFGFEDNAFIVQKCKEPKLQMELRDLRKVVFEICSKVMEFDGGKTTIADIYGYVGFIGECLPVFWKTTDARAELDAKSIYYKEYYSYLSATNTNKGIRIWRPMMIENGYSNIVYQKVSGLDTGTILGYFKTLPQIFYLNRYSGAIAILKFGCTPNNTSYVSNLLVNLLSLLYDYTGDRGFLE